MIRYFLVILICLASCDNSLHREYYGNGNIKSEYGKSKNEINGIYKEYYDNGNIKLIHNYKVGTLVDSSMYFDENKKDVLIFKRLWGDNLSKVKQVEYFLDGTLKKEGYVNDEILKIGKWNFYNKKGELDFIREYKIIDGKHHLNQAWKINNLGDTLYNGSKYFDIQLLSDTISQGKAILGAAFLRSELFKDKKSEIIVCVPNEKSINFNEEFSNFSIVRLDTFYNLQHDIINQKNFEGHSKPYSVAFGKKIRTNGRKKLRGFIEEYYEENDSIYSTKMFFSIPVYVKKTLSEK